MKKKQKNNMRHQTRQLSGQTDSSFIVDIKHMDQNVLDFLSALPACDVEEQEISARKLIAAGFIDEARVILNMTRNEYEDFVVNVLEGEKYEN